MNKFLLLLLLLSLAHTSIYAQHEIGKARMVQGKYVFFYNQPIAAYDVAFSFQSTYSPNEKMTINDVITGCMTGALTEAGAQLKPFDAIIIQPGARDVAIKFKDSVAPSDRALLTAQKVNGKYLFSYCEPVTDYNVIKTERVAWFNFMFGGAYYSTSQVEANLLKTAQKIPASEAILFNRPLS